MDSDATSLPPDACSTDDGFRYRVPCEPEEIERDELERLRGMSLADRGRLLAMACRAAARLDRSRAAAGLPPPAEEPWPKSTWEFLRNQARQHAQSRSS